MMRAVEGRGSTTTHDLKVSGTTQACRHPPATESGTANTSGGRSRTILYKLRSRSHQDRFFIQFTSQLVGLSQHVLPVRAIAKFLA